MQYNGSFFVSSASQEYDDHKLQSKPSEKSNEMEIKAFSKLDLESEKSDKANCVELI